MNWCISDIHGCSNTLASLVSCVFTSDPKATFVFGGDYVDRGKNSKQVIDFLLRLRNRTKCSFLRGNHEDMLIHWLTEGKDAWDQGMSTGLYRYIIPTLESYGMDIYSPRDQFPEEHRDFLIQLKPFHLEKNFFQCHAWFPDRKLPREERFGNFRNDEKAQMIWGRFSSICITEEKPWGIPGVFGHTPTCNYQSPRKPVLTKHIKLIDTGSFVDPEQGGGVICAYCPDNETYFVTPTQPEDLIQYHDGRRRV